MITSKNFILILVVTFINVALADLHRLFVGNLAAPASIHLLVFDDEALTLNKTATINSRDPHAWITFDVGTLLSLLHILTNKQPLRKRKRISTASHFPNLEQQATQST